MKLSVFLLSLVVLLSATLGAEDSGDSDATTDTSNQENNNGASDSQNEGSTEEVEEQSQEEEVDDVETETEDENDCGEYCLIEAQDWSFVSTYAPYVGLHSADTYNPSSVEFFLANTDTGDSQFPSFWTKPIEPLSDPYERRDWFNGQDPATDEVPCYVFVFPVLDEAIASKGQLKKAYNQTQTSTYVAKYQYFYPYNYGKEVVGVLEIGSHVGDIETAEITFVNGAPEKIGISVHGDLHYYEWDEVPRFVDTHPVIYSAFGSHALYMTIGKHEYAGKAAALVKIYDETDDKGELWEPSIEMSFPWEWHKATVDWVTGANAAFPHGFPYFTNVLRWGNDHMGVAFKGEYQLNNGPQGFLSDGYNEEPLTNVFEPGLMCGGVNPLICEIPVGIYESYPCAAGFWPRMSKTQERVQGCFLVPYGASHTHCNELIDPILDCSAEGGRCNAPYSGSVLPWSDTVTTDGSCVAGTCRAMCKLSPRNFTDNRDYPHYVQAVGGEWRRAREDVVESEEHLWFDAGTSTQDSHHLSHGVRTRFHDIPTGVCLPGYVLSADNSECYQSKYAQSHCYRDTVAPDFNDLQQWFEEKATKCMGSFDSCGDSYHGHCDEDCGNSYCTTVRQRQFASFAMAGHWVCHRTLGTYVSFEQFMNTLDDSPFTWNGDGEDEFACVMPNTHRVAAGGQNSRNNAHVVFIVWTLLFVIAVVATAAFYALFLWWKPSKRNAYERLPQMGYGSAKSGL